MTRDEWLILLMGIVLACAPMVLAWTEDRARARGIAVPALLTVKGYSLSPHSLFSLGISVMLLYLSKAMSGTGLSFVFMVFGAVGVATVISSVRKTKDRS